MFKVVLCQRSFSLILRDFSVQQTSKMPNYNFDKIMQKRKIICVYLPYTLHFMHFQSVRQKKWNIHNKTNKYRWHFRTKSWNQLNALIILTLIKTSFCSPQTTSHRWLQDLLGHLFAQSISMFGIMIVGYLKSTNFEKVKLTIWAMYIVAGCNMWILQYGYIK